MANGLLQQEEGKRMEDIGDENVESLVWRSLFQVVERDEEGYIKAFAMHDLVHDLACSVAKNECCNVLWSHQKANVPNGIRHLLVSFYNTNLSSTMFHSMHQTVPKLRTIILNSFVRFNARFSLPDVRSTFKGLRALKVEYLGTELPEYIGKLKHLRYLDLSFGEYKYLPESICGLRNLQTLKLNNCGGLEALPKSLSNLRSLRHLDISGSENLREMPMSMGKMTCLQTLSFFIVGSKKGQYITELERMENLGGEIRIKCLEKVRNRRDAECAKLMRKKRLGKLMLEWSYNDTAEEENDKEVIEGLQPDSNLRRLHIENYQGIRFPSWLECSILPNLLHITLSGCRRCEALPHSIVRLPFLKKLVVTGMPLVKTLFSDSDIDSDDVVSRCPSLESLQLCDMDELEEWCSFEEQMFMSPSLKHLTIENIPKLTRLPTSPSLKTLKMRKCNEMVLGCLVKNLPCLFRLEIVEFDEVVCFPEGSLQNLAALESLSIKRLKKLQILPREAGELSKLVHLEVEWCDELVSLPQVGRSCLRSLKITGCESLTNLRGLVSGCQTTLGYLDIYRCPKLEWSSLEFEHLTALENLTIGGFSEMTSLPDVIQHLSSTLQTLTLNHLNSLSSLPQWMGSLTQLRYLSITICMELTMLPDELRHLTNLHTLYIQCCHPELHTRCKSIEGEDWHKISHIPKLIIGDDDQY